MHNATTCNTHSSLLYQALTNLVTFREAKTSLRSKRVLGQREALCYLREAKQAREASERTLTKGTRKACGQHICAKRKHQ